MSSIVTLTLNPAVDTSSSVDRVVPEQKLRCKEPCYDPGGGGLNVARAIHQLGGNAQAYWMCGGLAGKRLSELLDQEQINHIPITIEEETRQNLIVFEESTDQQYRFGMPGATLTESEIESCIDQITKLDPPPRFLVLSGSLPPGVDPGLYARIAETVPGTCQVVLDASGEPLKHAIKSPVYLVKPNLRELGEIAGHPIENDEEIRAISRSLVEKERIKVVVVTLGSGGAVLTVPGDQYEIRAPTVPIRSKVGAGDSTVAGIVLALCEGRSIEEATMFGVAAGAAAVMSEGTKLCSQTDTSRLFTEMLEQSQDESEDASKMELS